jgi:hypothetical protein
MTDPRFDPRFQRGYSGDGLEAPDVAPPVAAPEPVDTEAPADRATPADPATRIERAQPDTPEPAATHVDVAVGWAPATANPYRRALLLTGLAMLLGAGVLIGYSIKSSNLPFGSATDDIGQQALNSLEYLVFPALVVGGFVCIIVWLAMGAVTARDSERD